MDEQTEATPNPDLGLLRQRAPRAVERWFREHADPLYTFVFYRVGRDAELATDVVQETFVAALRKIEDYDPRRGAMMPWLTYLARNRIRAALRQRSRTGAAGASWDEIDRRLLQAYRNLATAPLPDEVLERRETVELVQMALSNLPDNYRWALKQHYCEQRSLAEIARSRESTEGAVKSLLHRARLAFRAAFQTIADSLEEPTPTRRVTP
jgi:RNA polymerase sigma-70 factor (ECF subfamily)